MVEILPLVMNRVAWLVNRWHLTFQLSFRELGLKYKNRFEILECLISHSLEVWHFKTMFELTRIKTTTNEWPLLVKVFMNKCDVVHFNLVLQNFFNQSCDHATSLHCIIKSSYVRCTSGYSMVVGQASMQDIAWAVKNLSWKSCQCCHHLLQ